MPMITVRYITPREGEDVHPHVAELPSRRAHGKLSKDQSVTAVLVEPENPQNWFIAGQRPVEAGLAGYWLDIASTAGTNTTDETSEFVKAVLDEMGTLLGPDQRRELNADPCAQQRLPWLWRPHA